VLIYWCTAKTVAAVHLAFATYMVLGWWAIVLGALFRARWARHRLFRLTHLAGFLTLLAFALVGRPCPLTDLEFWLLEHSGELAYDQGPFLVRLIAATLYPDVSPALLFWLSLFFGSTTLALWWLVPPKSVESWW